MAAAVRTASVSERAEAEEDPAAAASFRPVGAEAAVATAGRARLEAGARRAGAARRPRRCLPEGEAAGRYGRVVWGRGS